MGRQQSRLEAEEAHVPEGVTQPSAREQRLALRQLQLNQPADLELLARGVLHQPREAEGAVWRIRSKLVELLLEPTLELLGRDRHTWMAADSELNHAPSIDLCRAANNGCQRPSPAAQMGQDGEGWALRRIGASRSQRKHGETMQSDPFLDFHRTAEAAGYPAMLIVSVFALALVVAPVMLLALTRAVWVLVIAVLSIFAALALLAGAFGAAVADADEPPPQSQGTTSPRRIA